MRRLRADVAKAPIAATPAHGAEVARLSALLQEKKWRDKDEDVLKKVAALAPTPIVAPSAAQEEEADSGDI